MCCCCILYFIYLCTHTTNLVVPGPLRISLSEGINLSNRCHTLLHHMRKRFSFCWLNNITLNSISPLAGLCLCARTRAQCTKQQQTAHNSLNWPRSAPGTMRRRRTDWPARMCGCIWVQINMKIMGEKNNNAHVYFVWEPICIYKDQFSSHRYCF